MWKVWALVVALAGLAGGAGVARAAPGSCRGERLPAAYAGRVERALAAGRDVWGEALLDSASGPTLQGAERYLAPLLFAGHVPGRRSVPLTGSDIYYLPFAEPETAGGPGQVALDLADGSEVDLGVGRRAAHPDRRGADRPRAVRVVPGPSRHPRPPRRLPAGARDPLPRRRRRPLPGGVVRSARAADTVARELHPARRRSERRCDGPGRRPVRPLGSRPHGCRREARARSRHGHLVQPGRPLLRVVSDVCGAGVEAIDDLRRLARPACPG